MLTYEVSFEMENGRTLNMLVAAQDEFEALFAAERTLEGTGIEVCEAKIKEAPIEEAMCLVRAAAADNYGCNVPHPLREAARRLVAHVDGAAA